MEDLEQEIVDTVADEVVIGRAVSEFIERVKDEPQKKEVLTKEFLLQFKHDQRPEVLEALEAVGLILDMTDLDLDFID